METELLTKGYISIRQLALKDNPQEYLWIFFKKKLFHKNTGQKYRILSNGEDRETSLH